MKQAITYVSVVVAFLAGMGSMSYLDKEIIQSQKQTTVQTTTTNVTQVSKKHTCYNLTEKVKTSKASTTKTEKAVNRPKKSQSTAKITTTVTTQVETPINKCEVPYGDNFYGYMDYRTITDTNSDQYKFQQNCWTDSQGLRRQCDDYVVALGSFYSTTIGERFSVVLDTGVTYTIVVGDCKADCHTNSTNQYVEVGNKINIIEFIVDIYTLDYNVAQSGNIGTYDNLTGNVISITKIE